jgi:NAD(P)H-hydrate epimerase
MVSTNMIYVTAAQMREIDRRAIHEIGIPGVVLMENAGRRVFDEATRMVAAGVGSVLVLCGKGNNGGDGFVVARHLINNGYTVEMYLVGSAEEVSGDAKINLTVLQRMGITVHEVQDDRDVQRIASKLDSAALVIDALLGTGLKGSVTGLYATIISALSGSKARVLSVDVPSGIDADTGEPLGVSVRAEKTVTFQYPKIGFKNPDAAQFLGKLIVADIGIPRTCIERGA